MRDTSWRPPAVLVAAAIIAALFAGCGSSSAPSASGAASTSRPSSAPTATSASAVTTGSGLSGSPIVTYTFADVVTSGPAYPNIEQTARVAADWINAHGGIHGHPLEERFCDSKGTPTGAATCAHEAVAAHAVAVVGSFEFTSAAIVPILAAAHIPWFGEASPVAPIEYTSPDSFPIGNTPLWTVGLVYRAIQDGCHSIGAVMYAGTQIFEPLMTNAAKALGDKTPIKYVTLPATSTDDSPEAAEVTGGTDCLVLAVPEEPMSALIPALLQTGAQERYYGPNGNLDPVSVKGYTAQTSGSVIAMFGYSDLSRPAWADFRQALHEYHADPSLQYDSVSGLGTWAAYQAFLQVARTITGPITHKSFLAAADKATVRIPGAIPTIDFAKPWGTRGGPAAFARLMNTSDDFDKLENGKLVPYVSKFTNFANLALGKPLR